MFLLLVFENAILSKNNKKKCLFCFFLFVDKISGRGSEGDDFQKTVREKEEMIVIHVWLDGLQMRMI